MHATNTRLPSTQHGQIATSPSPETHQPKTSTRFSTPASGTAKRQGASVKEALKALCIDLTSLKQSRSPELSDIVSTCEKLKSYEDWLKQARQVPNVHTELQQLRALLPAFFKLIDRCLAIHQDIALDADALQALCLGLSALAPPMPGPLLTEAQCSAARPVLTAISLKLAAQLGTQFAHTDADAGRLLNCLNWYSRALKADLLLKNQPGVNALFHTALEQIQQWSDRQHVDLLNSRQLGKCMVQLNTMTRQQLIDIDRSNAAGQANREIWAGCVRNLCQKFLSNDQWLASCNTIELINVTNTLKDGLELDLLRREDTTLTTAFDRIALRLRQQPFAEAGHLAELGNCANFLRCLFEHDLLGGHDEPTGQAMRHLTDEIGQLDTRQSVSRQNAQQLINLASFLKAADRWLAGTGQMRGDGSHVPLARATASLIAIICQLGKADTQWMCTPQTTALLSALQHLWQRGLVSTSHGAAFSHLLIQLLQQIPQWQLNDSHRPLVLQSLRALIALTTGRPLASDLKSTAEFGHALRTLLQHLQQSRPATISHNDQLATLQAVHVGITLGILTLKQFQPLLQHLLKTSKPVDLSLLAQAIQAGDTAAGSIETLSSQALDLPQVMADANPAKVHKQPGATYRGQAPAPKPAPSALPHRDPLTTSENPWIEPRHGAKSTTNPPLTVTPSPPPTLRAASTIPTLTTHQRLQPATSYSGQATIAQKGAIAQTPAASTVKALPAKARLTLQQAQREWFELLNDRASKVLPRLQTLANQYPELLSQKSAGKRGHTALFHALTKGRKEIVNWLINHPQHTFDGDLGSFLQEALDAIGLVERNHVASIRLLISAEVERHDRRFSDQQAQQFPEEQLPAKAIIKAHRATMLSADQKAALARFAELRPMLEEFKLILPNKPVKASEKTPRTTLTTGAAQLGAHPAMNPGLELEAKPVEQRSTSSAERRHDGLDPHGVVSSTNRPARASDQTTADTAPLLAYSGPDWLDKLEAKQKDQRFLDYYASLSKPRLPRKLTEFEKVLEVFAAGMPSETEYITSNGLGSSGNEAINQYAAHTGLDIMTFSVCTDDLPMLERSMQNASHRKTLTESWNAHGLNALMVAAYAGKTQMVSAMLRALNSDHDVVKTQSNAGMNAVMAAAARGNAATVAAILRTVPDQDALLMAQDNEGRTALMLAVINGHVETVKVILDAAQDKDAVAMVRDHEGWSALFHAVSAGRPDLISAIIRGVRDRMNVIQEGDFHGLSALNVASARLDMKSAAAIMGIFN